MRIKYSIFLLMGLILTNSHLNAQIEQVSVGPSYTQQAYYSFAEGTVAVLDNDAWDIAFTNGTGADAGIFINESAGSGTSPISLFLSDAEKWEDEIIDEGQFVDSLRLFNPKENWNEGAFNSKKDASNFADFGWGEYQPTSNTVEGTKIYVIRLRDESLIKLEVLGLVSGEYTFRYASLDGSNEMNGSISKSDNKGPVMLYSLLNNEEVNIPKDYDLIFQRYYAELDLGDGTTVPYPVTGVLSGPGVQVAKAEGVDPETVQEVDYESAYSSELAVIGHEWKSFDFMQGWLITSNLAYFVQTQSGEKYKVVFLDFEGSDTGISTFEKTQLLNSNTIESIKETDINVFPNPFSHQITVELLKHDGATAKLFDNRGRLIQTALISKSGVLKLPDLTPGRYILQLLTEDEVYVKSLIK